MAPELIYGAVRPFDNGDRTRVSDHYFGTACETGDCPLCRLGSVAVLPAVIPVELVW